MAKKETMKDQIIPWSMGALTAYLYVQWTLGGQWQMAGDGLLDNLPWVLPIWAGCTNLYMVVVRWGRGENSQ